MGRYRESVCRLCRRENLKLFLKGDRCFSDKCAFDRRGYPPGEHGQLRPKFSGYGIQLREKQKVKRMYGLSEGQFRRVFAEADRRKGITGSTLLVLLESRLDNAVYRLGFVNSRTQGRQLIRHNHFLVNGKNVDIPSYVLSPGDVIEVREKSRNMQVIDESLAAVERRGVPQWLSLEKENKRGVVKNLPVREDITIPIQEQLIVELYSK
ncbi:30S ribosomal protein S4 [Desulfosudis oleivorans]|uniref:Small ribosomal subunit protein uS4 n=1 Tax=Desulfosudis oleivorans (strain DSM 6200 / JCM 39069 / Hxd3) TaxID=96561 RepID=RS4_DESOH|nr:30S ribosomal protein S4 [Desulfosudis oleivorans]A8ZV81.1 RecName: Full=Small ribosomal subunit protein uS4; AltName: Full=30S ribosomal protein S4 [Desulfosudis oleivorans Hxd3]ABW66542.1 RNA-binding S4 domain protein [Desulfosudis oleivorans Hxd3]